MLNVVFLAAYIQFMRWLERDKQEKEQQADALKRALNNVTTDVQTSLPDSPFLRTPSSRVHRQRSSSLRTPAYPPKNIS